MSEIVEFKFNNNAIACVVINGNPWFRVDYADTKKAIAKNVSEDDRKKMDELMGVSQTPLDHNAKNAIYINESGLYCLIFGSKKREAVGHIRGAALYQETR